MILANLFFKIGVNKAINFPIQDSVGVGFFVIGAGVFD